jgi:hypothetical protein
VDEGQTERQKKWFATARRTLERETGKTWEEWAAIARTCPETTTAARKTWLIEHHGVPSGKAMMIAHGAWDQPVDLADALWADPASRAILAAVDAAMGKLPQVVRGQRKSFTAYSRTFQFAALRPVKGGTALLGLALEPDDGLRPPKRESWSERLLSTLPLASPGEVDARVEGLLRKAWERS